MKKLIALLLSLALLLTCTAVFADAVPEEGEIQTANYQFQNLTGKVITSITMTDNKTGEALEFLENDTVLEPETILYSTIYVDASETKEDLEHRYTLSFKDADGEVYEFKTLSFENVLIDLLAPDAMTGATPIKFNPKMYQIGKYKIINKTDKVLDAVTITQNADPNNNSTVMPAIGKDAFAYVDFIMDPDSEASHALTIEFTFDDGTKCSFEKLSIEEVSMTLTPDTITGATPFTFGPIDAE